MFGMLLWIIRPMVGLIFFLVWNSTTLLIIFLIVLSGGIYVSYSRIYFSFKRIKVGGRKTVLVTGGSGGIGFSLAKLFVEDQYTVVVIARNEKRLEMAEKELEKIASHKNQEVICWSIDLSKPESAEEVLKKLEENQIQVDILVNNAGFGSLGSLLEQKKDIETSMITTNCISLVNLTKLLLPGMISRNEGYILNVASVLGFFPVPLHTTYAATKFFVRAFSLGLSAELDEYSNVSCTALSPGSTTSRFMVESLKNIDGISEEDFLKKTGIRMQSSDSCAYEGYRGLLKREREVVSGLDNFILARILMSVVPTWMVLTLGMKVMKPILSVKKKDE